MFGKLKRLKNLFIFISMFKEGYSGFHLQSAITLGHITERQGAYLKKRFPNDVL